MRKLMSFLNNPWLNVPYSPVMTSEPFLLVNPYCLDVPYYNEPWVFLVNLNDQP